MKMNSYIMNAPRLDWGICRSCHVDESPSGYTAYLILWDAGRHGEGWFEENRSEIVGTFYQKHLYPGYSEAFEVLAIKLEHVDPDAEPVQLSEGVFLDPNFTKSLSGTFVTGEEAEVDLPPEALSDEQIISLASARVNRPIEFSEGLTEWKSVQEDLSIDECFLFRYHILILRAEGNRFIVSLAVANRFDESASNSGNDLTFADLVEEDESAEISVPKEAFKAAYLRAMGGG